tara:strand:- start:1407 stop:1658 length:252 start_codon:yes stop_codon:yes gene_type:complete
MSSLREKTGTLTAGQQLTKLGKALGIIKEKELKKDSKGRVIDTDKKTPKLNIKTKTVYKKKKKQQKSASPKGTKFFDFLTTEK